MEMVFIISLITFKGNGVFPVVNALKIHTPNKHKVT